MQFLRPNQVTSRFGRRDDRSSTRNEPPECEGFNPQGK